MRRVRSAKCVFAPRVLLRLPLSGVPACYRGARTRAAIRIDGARGRGPEQCRNDVCGRASRTARTTNRDAAVGPLPADLAARALELDRDGIRLDAGSLRDGAVADRHPGAGLTGRGVLRADLDQRLLELTP